LWSTIIASQAPSGDQVVTASNPGDVVAFQVSVVSGSASHTSPSRV
jgi:hypothetical protein